MGIVYVLLPISLLLALGGLGAFFWAARRGQFDDLDSPSVRILFDNDEVEASKAEERS
jgi:cbb3-type cytochrome oxidase maturation protein